MDRMDRKEGRKEERKEKEKEVWMKYGFSECDWIKMGCMWVCTGKCMYVHKYCNGILSKPEINILQENQKRSKLKITKEEMGALECCFLIS